MQERQWRKSATFWESVQHAIDGTAAILAQHRNTRIIVSMFVLAIVLAALLRLPAFQFAIIVFVAAVVLAAEMFNTALEVTYDLLWPEYREAVKISKDLLAGAVFVLSVAAGIVGLVLLGPPLLRLFF